MMLCLYDSTCIITKCVIKKLNVTKTAIFTSFLINFVVINMSKHVKIFRYCNTMIYLHIEHGKLPPSLNDNRSVAVPPENAIVLCWKDKLVISYHDGHAVVSYWCCISTCVCVCIHVYRCCPIVLVQYCIKVSKYDTHFVQHRIMINGCDISRIFSCLRLFFCAVYDCWRHCLLRVEVRAHSVSHRWAHIGPWCERIMWCSPFVRI